VSDKLKPPGDAKRKATPYSPGLSLDDFQRMSEIFRSWIRDEKLKWWIIFAGVGGIVELLHTIWLAARYVFKF
jgi:hypothetical protein